MNYRYYKAINWDQVADPIDHYTWEQLATNFWLDKRVPIEDDQAAWSQLPQAEQQQIERALAGASLISLMQSEWGTPSLRHDIATQQEESVLNTMTFMKSVHAKSATTIFRKLTDQQTAHAAFQFADHQKGLQVAADLLIDVFQHGNPLQKKTAFIMAETVAVFGSYLIIKQHPQLQNVNQMVNNVVRGSGIFTAFVGYKFRVALNNLAPNQRALYIEWLTHFQAKLCASISEFLSDGCDAADAVSAMNAGLQHALTQLEMEELMPEVDSTGQPWQHLLITPDEFKKAVTTAATATASADVQQMQDDDYQF